MNCLFLYTTLCFLSNGEETDHAADRSVTFLDVDDGPLALENGADQSVALVDGALGSMILVDGADGPVNLLGGVH